MTRVILFFISLLTFCLPSYALGKISGQLDIKYNYYPETEKKSENLGARLRTSYDMEMEKAFIRLGLDMRADTLESASGVVVGNSNSRKNVDLDETYIEVSGKNVSTKLGFKEYDFSLLEKVSPADAVNPRDWTDLVDSEKKPVFSLWSRYEKKDWFLEGVYIPYFMPSILPEKDNPWNILPENIFMKKADLDNRFEGQFFARFGITLADIDMTMSVFHGRSYSPSYKYEPLPDGNLTAQPCYNRENSVIFGTSQLVGDFTLNTEIAWIDQDGRDDYLQYGASISYLFSDVFSAKDSLFLLLQYNDEIVVNETRPDDYDLKRSVLGVQTQLKYSLGDTDITVEGALNKGGDYIIKPSIEKTIPVNKASLKEMKVKLGYSTFGGDKGEFFGDFKKNDTISLLCIFKF